MSINSMDNKFGLPKPDFQGLPKKKTIWPVLIVLAILTILVAGKVGYNFYCKVFNPQSPMLPLHSAQDNNPTDYTKEASRSLSASSTSTNATEIAPNTHDGKKNRVRKSISATQKKLAAKQNKSLVKPGTYRVLKRPQGIYHLVVVSHLDKLSAMKEVQQLIKKKLGVYLILPRIDKGEKYYRVTIGHSSTRYEADEKLKQFNSINRHMFVLKY